MSRCGVTILPLLLGLLLDATGASARTWNVAPNGSGDAPTIQAGIDSAAAGDTVLLENGTFTGDGNRNVRYHGKSVVVRSESGDPTLCIVDCVYLALARGFIFDGGEGPEAVLEGIEITKGWTHEAPPPAEEGGGGIQCISASPTLRNLIVSGCKSEQLGGGIWCSDGSAPALTNVVVEHCEADAAGGMYCHDSSPILTDVTFYVNYATYSTAGGALCEGGAPSFTRVKFINNSASWGVGGLKLEDGCKAELDGVQFDHNVGINGGGLGCMVSSPVLRNCVFTGNWGAIAGGVWLGSSSPTIAGCTFYGNTGGDAGGIGLYYEGSSVVVENTILAGSTEGAAIYPDCAQVTLTCCDIFGNAGGDWTGCLAAQLGTSGNFAEDPLLCNPADGVFTLQNCSPCLPEHNPTGYGCSDIIGALGSGCSCGQATEPTTWGALKARFKQGGAR